MFAGDGLEWLKCRRWHGAEKTERFGTEYRVAADAMRDAVDHAATVHPRGTIVNKLPGVVRLNSSLDAW